MRGLRLPTPSSVAFDLALLWDSLPRLWSGLLVALQLVGISLLAGGALTLPLAFARV